VEPSASDRLDSWKEIAAYLKRDVRTVYRWEKDQGLPVHRHQHKKRGTVYAYKAELDAWWNNRRPHLEPQLRQEAEARRHFRRELTWLALAAFVLIAAAVGSRLLRPSALPFEARDWVLIADFENRTGEEIFDGVLEYALERELSNSQFVNVVPRPRINDTLRLMRRSLATPLTSTVAREICLRDGGIRALLTGRVEKLDATYLLSVALVAPSRGVAVASFSEEATGQKEVVGALGRLSDRVRRALGEELSLIQQTEQRLEQVTTPSLRALQLYSQADTLIVRENSAAAEELLKQAVKEDPEFASAFMHLAWALFNQGRRQEEYRPFAERAVELAEGASERERYFIRASYHQMMEEAEMAVGTYEALLRLYPDHVWGVNNLTVLLWQQGRPDEATPYQVRLAELRPKDFRVNLDAAWALSTYDLGGARPYLERARALASPEARKSYPEGAAFLALFAAMESSLKGQVGRAHEEVDRVAESVPTRAGEERENVAFQVGLEYLALGKLEAAQEMLSSIPINSRLPRWPEALVAFVREDQQALRRVLLSPAYAQAPRTPQITAFLLVRAGLFPEAEKMLSAVETIPGWNSIVPDAVAGELALARGQTNEAVPLLESSLGTARAQGLLWLVFLLSESLARAREIQGNGEDALRVLEEAAQAKNSFGLFGPMTGTLWQRVEWQRARLHRKMGREPEAQQLEADLRKLLAYADPDHPILRRLLSSQGGPQASQ
jgi:tetratricopeptide (TPR) repeat protein